MAIDPQLGQIPQYTPQPPPRNYDGLLIGGVILGTIFGFYVGGYFGVAILAPITFVLCRWLRKRR